MMSLSIRFFFFPKLSEIALFKATDKRGVSQGERRDLRAFNSRCILSVMIGCYEIINFRNKKPVVIIVSSDCFPVLGWDS